MKILFCNFIQPDYGLDLLYDGLCKKFGYENIHEYPHKPFFHGSINETYKNYPQYFNYPTVTTDFDKYDNLKNNRYDIIVIGCRANIDFRYSWTSSINSELSNIFNLIVEKSKTIPTFLVDQDDLPGINFNLFKNLLPNSLLYFKREYLKNTKYDNDIKPLSFSYSEDYINKEFIENKYQPVFWAGAPLYNRKDYINVLEQVVCKNFGIGMSQQEYKNQISNSYIGINLKGGGWDCVRYYELPFSSCLLFSQRLNIVINNDFVDGKSAIFFDNPDDFREKLKYYLNNVDISVINEIRHNGFDHALKYHTSLKRADEFITVISEYV